MHLRRLMLTVLLLAILTTPLLPSSVVNAETPHLNAVTHQPARYTVSYADALSWLDTLPADQRDDQIRDYATLGLANLLGLNIEQLRNALYDQSPARDPLFWDLTSSPIGPGRSLFDGEETLHILVPSDDAYAVRTIALELDDHRKDAGADAASAVVYRYVVDEDSHDVSLVTDGAVDTPTLRSNLGYVNMRIETQSDLERFLSSTHHLSQLRVVDDTPYVGGWNWPGVPHGQVATEDIAVLQQGYLTARGEPLTVTEFLTEYDVDRLNMNLTIPATAIARADHLNGVFIALKLAESDEAYGEFLVDYADVILDTVLDPGVAAGLAQSRNTMREDQWLYELSTALGDEFDRNPLWGVLLYIAGGTFYVPADGVTEPGFSLDPGPLASLDELFAVLGESRYPELRGNEEKAKDFISIYASEDGLDTFWEFIDANQEFVADVVLTDANSAAAEALLNTADNAQSQEEYASAYTQYADLINAAVDDRERPWKLLLTSLEGESPYQYARYDGGLAGTEVGMTYFYTDILAKGYFDELGRGNPYGIVDGFTPTAHKEVPWSHCTLEEEKGRIWFGLNEEAVGLHSRQVNLGDVATRVFVLVTDPVDGELEIEPSYKFGQGIRWWDRHYIAMADYEPQYHRLDQLMRWGAAISWLVENDMPLLPTPSDETIRRNLRFDEWLASQTDLTWEYDVPFVNVPTIETETVLRLFSEPYDACGTRWISSGGISNPSMQRMAEIAELKPELPMPVARAGLSNAGTDYAQNHASGVIVTLDGVIRRLEPIEPHRANIATEAPGRRVWSLGEVKVDVPETLNRLISTSLIEDGDLVTWQVNVQERSLGQVVVRREGDTARVGWNAGPLAELKESLDDLQALLTRVTLDQAVATIFDDADIFTVDDGPIYIRMLGADGSTASSELLVELSTVNDSSDGTLHFRLARPIVDAETNRTVVEWYYVRLVDESPPSNG